MAPVSVCALIAGVSGNSIKCILSKRGQDQKRFLSFLCLINFRLKSKPEIL